MLRPSVFYIFKDITHIIWNDLLCVKTYISDADTPQWKETGTVPLMNFDWTPLSIKVHLFSLLCVLWKRTIGHTNICKTLFYDRINSLNMNYHDDIIISDIYIYKHIYIYTYIYIYNTIWSSIEYVLVGQSAGQKKYGPLLSCLLSVISY